MATRQQLLESLSSRCLHDHYVHHWSYHEIETADTELYFRCGLMKVIPLSPGFLASQSNSSAAAPVVLDPFLIHHLPDKYVKEGTFHDKFHLTADLLLRWLSQCAASPY